MAEETVKTVDEAIAVKEAEEQVTASPESSDKPEESSEETQQVEGDVELSEAQSQFDKKQALINKFKKMSAEQDVELQSLNLGRYDQFLTPEQQQQIQVPVNQTPVSLEDDEPMTVGAMKQMLGEHKKQTDRALAAAIEAPQKTQALAQTYKYMKALQDEGTLTQDDMEQISSALKALPDSTSWDQAAIFAKELCDGKAARNLLNDLNLSKVEISKANKETLKDITQPSSAPAPQPVQDENTLESGILESFKKVHERKVL